MHPNKKQNTPLSAVLSSGHPSTESNKHHKMFTPDMFTTGIHIFCDGAAVPNPGAGGWGVVVYRDGEEISTSCGGDPEATNNAMEMTALLVAIEKAQGLWSTIWPTETIKPVTIWCDSQYAVKGANEWRHGWRKNGWARGGPNAEPKNRILANAELWKAIDEALGDILKSEGISIRWVKGHNGIVGNERADELAEQGRQELAGKNRTVRDFDLDDRYRQIMGAV